MAQEVVGGFYDHFPYPAEPFRDGPPLDFDWCYSLEMVYGIFTGSIGFINNLKKTIRILDAGCGTGVSTDQLAHLNPGAEIHAIDISRRSIDLASERLKRSGGIDKVNLSFENISLFDINLKNEFHYINSIGVLHHLNDPQAGLNALESMLVPGGIIHLFVYADLGRLQIKRVKNALQLMNIKSTKKGLKLARELLNTLYIKENINKNNKHLSELKYLSDTDLADVYFHPVEDYFSLQNLFELIASTNLQFLGFSNPKDWSLDKVLDGELLDIALDMPRVKQLQLIEYLDPGITHFDFFLSKEPMESFEWTDQEKLLSAYGKISSFIRGWPSKTLYDHDMNLIELTTEEFAFMSSVQRNPGKTLGLLPFSKGRRSLAASIARDLYQKHLLLLSL